MNSLFSRLVTTNQNVYDHVEGVFQPKDDLEETINALSMNSVYIATALLIVLVLIASKSIDKHPRLKKPLFISIATLIVSVSTFMIGSTIYLNTKSVSGGPVHWHAGIEVWACGEKQEIRDPEGRWSNKIGTATLHEHNDEFIHLEGVIVEEPDASLGKFFHVIGGALTDDFLAVPLNDDQVGVYEDGDTCSNGEVGEVQTYVYTINEVNGTDVYWQEKIDNPSDYILTGKSLFNEVECIIVEFGPTAAKTDRICHQFTVSEGIGEIVPGDTEGPY